MLTFALLLQSAAGPTLPVPRTLRATKDCSVPATAEGDDAIVVCGRAQEADRLRPLPEKYTQPTIPKAEIGVIGNVRVAAETEAAPLAGGQQSKRAMVRFKIPF